MTALHADEIITGYFARLETALAPVASDRRQELLNDVRAHISEARIGLAHETDADLLNILDRLGDPADMAAAEIGRAEPTPPKAPTSMALEIAAMVLLLLFWPVGVILLWISDAWTTREKLIGTLVPPGGYLAILVLGPLLALGAVGTACRTVSDEAGRVLSSTCPSSGVQTGIDIGLALLVIVYLIGPIVSVAYLGVRLRRARPGPSSVDREATPPLIDAADTP
ncbi:MAG: hypothetical protein M3003_16825 [Candidatus Dormibacteraeota bacterium]|nr:hypothetical protein [Candidatus Dormibacteraeota bacterium]